MPRLRITITIVVILVVSTAFVFFTPPGKWLLATWLQWRILQKHGLRIQLEESDFDLMPLRVSAREFRIFGGKKNDRTFFQAHAAEAQLFYSSLWSDELHFSKISLRSPAIFFDALPFLKESQRGSTTLQVDQLVIDELLASGAQPTVMRSIRGKWVRSSANITVETLKGSLQGATISAHGKWNVMEKPKYDFSYEIQADASIVNRWTTRIPPVTGPLRIAGRFGGTETNHFHKGFWEGENFQSKESGPFFVGGTYAIATPSEAPYQIEITYKNLPYIFIRTAFPKAPQFVTNLSGNLRYRGGTDLWKSDATFWANLENSSSQDGGLSGEVDGSIRNGKFFLDGIDLESGASTITFTGQFNRDSLNARVSAFIPNTGDLKPYFPSLAGFPGSYVLEGRLEGHYKQMVLRGTLTGANRHSLTGTTQVSVPAKFLSCLWLCNVRPVTNTRNQFEVAARSSGCF